jgi:hypothetical protein
MSQWIPFLTALIWPVAIFLLLTVYRRDVSFILALVRRRLEQGDKLTVGGITLESKQGAGVQSVVSSPVISNQANSILVATNTDAQGKVFIATSAGFRGDPAGLVGAGDVLGMAALQAAFLATPTVKVETAIIRPSYGNLPELIHDNPVFISVGGPDVNLLTRFVLSEVQTALAFDGLSILDRRNKKLYESTVDERTLTGLDYGFILSLPHPKFGAEGRAVLVAGCYGYGSQGAAMVLANIQEHKELWAVAEGGCFEGLVEVAVKKGRVEDLRVVEAFAFRSL